MVFDPLNKKGDYFQNKKRILDKSENIDANFLTSKSFRFFR